MKLVPFPNYEPDNDAVMTEAEPLYLPHHIRIPSNVSSASSDSSGTSSRKYRLRDLWARF